MQFSTASLILALSAAPLFVHGTNHHSLTCAVWPEACDDDHNEEEERRTLLDAQFDAVTAGTEDRPTRKLAKLSPPRPPLPLRPVFCDEFTMYWSFTEYKESILNQGSEPAQRGTKTCRGSLDPNITACRGDTYQAYFDLYAEPSLTTKIGLFADEGLIVKTEPDFNVLTTGSIEVNSTEFGGEILFSNLFGVRAEITAGSKSYLGATGTIEINTKPFPDGEFSDDGEFIIRCQLTNPSNP